MLTSALERCERSALAALRKRHKAGDSISDVEIAALKLAKRKAALAAGHLLPESEMNEVRAAVESPPEVVGLDEMWTLASMHPLVVAALPTRAQRDLLVSIAKLCCPRNSERE